MANEPTINYMQYTIAKFMGYNKVTVSYAGTEEETEWQRNNEEWMNKAGIQLVGGYIVDILNNKWHHWEDMEYHTSWDWLMPVWKKAGEILFEIRGDLLDDDYLKAHRITKSFITACQKVDIDRAHKDVYEAVQFITWYNQQGKHQCTDCGLWFKSDGRCPECNPLG